MALFKIFVDKKGLYHFLLKSDSKHIVFISAGFSSKANCIKKIQTVKHNSKNDRAFSRLKSKYGSPYFKFRKIKTDETIGISELFLNKSLMERKIEAIKQSAVHAPIDKLTYTI
ncbi:YegP family protein [Bizionia hallyeonensis]|uniref:YegP family protein n=1 Tax=Bizionia hallyeonensis TaxID=1123757 RepID=A0ABW0C110_9FLAO